MEKKVYADYHGPRCTREHDGKVAQWKYYGTAQKSKAVQTYANYNADCILDSGLHDVAALSYPLVGMQSQRDPDYIEYQILTAKLAHIDGFFVEWGFREHESNEELQIMMKMAQKLDFEIGINWCDAWHFYPWIEEFYPEAVTREKKVELFIRNVQYLLDTLYSTLVGATIEDHPLILLFGGGPTIEEFQKIRQAAYTLAAGVKVPYFLTRAPITGKEQGGQISYWLENNEWPQTVDGIFGWIPTRVRNGLATEQFKAWDRYALAEDSIAYLEVLRTAMKDTNSKVHISCVNPEMDNRACASWNKHDLSCIPRADGSTYEEMWKKNVKHKQEIDIVYIVSWNDYTERHQIEPTLNDGYREMDNTRRYASQFKDMMEEGKTEDFLLPLRLFYLRKKAKKLSAAGYSMVPYLVAMEQIAANISDGRLKEAELLLVSIEKLLEDLDSQLLTKQLFLTQESGELTAEGNQIHICSEEALLIMKEWAYDAWLYFSYFDGTEDSFQLFNGQQELCDIKMDGEGIWKKTKIRLFQENMNYMEIEPVIRVVGTMQVREVSLVLQAYRNWKG